MDRQRIWRIGAAICLVIMLLRLLGQLFTTFQAHYLMQGPLIPDATRKMVFYPQVIISSVYAMAALLGIILFHYRLHLAVILLLVASLFTKDIYLHYAITMAS